MKGSIIITLFFAAGVACGVTELIPEGFVSSRTSFLVLCALMFSVGMSIGCDSATLHSFRRLNPRLALLPLVTIAGTLAGSMASSLVHPTARFPTVLLSAQAWATIRFPAYS